MFGVSGVSRKIGCKMQVEQGFSSFFAIFDDFSKFGNAFSAHSTSKKSSNKIPKILAKNEEKSLVQLALKNPYCFQNPDFWYTPIHH